MAGRESTSSQHGGKSYGHSESRMLLGVSETASGITIQAAFTASFGAFSSVIFISASLRAQYHISGVKVLREWLNSGSRTCAYALKASKYLGSQRERCP